MPINALIDAIVADPAVAEAFVTDPEAELTKRGFSEQARATILRNGLQWAAAGLPSDGGFRPRWAGEPVRVARARATPAEVHPGDEVTLEVVGAHLTSGLLFMHLDREDAIGDPKRAEALAVEVLSSHPGSDAFGTVVTGVCTIPDKAVAGRYFLHLVSLVGPCTASPDASSVSFEIVRDLVTVVGDGD